ncbi:OGG1 [Hepatospora eriocheir]|uniref:DNA-(apurinic or apyrimidinic site) lyase n=1 Tax=Hepatospora eriocheir TaxID=1081669 RepID=A0A1X0QFY0_9MICR|nr:OGG1 [Hepatospora eriocheir]
MIKEFFNIDIIVIKQDNYFKINELIINDDLICKVFDKHHQSCRFITNDLYSAIFSFICSQNNNIQRITKLVSFIYSLGEPIKYKNIIFNKFPKLDKLFDFDLLKDKKFGYRARYVVDAAKFLNETPVDNNNISDLLRIKGVGRKVFDCICLTSLRKFHLVPIDIHVFKWSKVFFKLSFNSLTQKNYQQIQREWSNKFGRYAGIIQLFIFKESTLK